MAGEWLRALGALPLEALNEAAGKAIRTLKFWPTPAEIIALAGEHTADLRAALDHAQLMAHERPSLQVTRGAGDEDAAPATPSAAEFAAVEKLCAAWRQRLGENAAASDRMDDWTPPPQEGASETLKHSRLVRGVPIP